jgi:hypothetical protein
VTVYYCFAIHFDLKELGRKQRKRKRKRKRKGKEVSRKAIAGAGSSFFLYDWAHVISHVCMYVCSFYA